MTSAAMKTVGSLRACRGPYHTFSAPVDGASEAPVASGLHPWDGGTPVRIGIRATLISILAVAALAGAMLGCSKKPAPGGAGDLPVVIGFSMDTLREERWQRDRDLFVARGEELGAKVLVQAANSDDALQNSQADNLLTQGIDVLVVAAHNGKTAASIVEAAHKMNVPVIAYDRLIQDSDLDLYMSFDGERVGELQAEYVLQRVPKGNYLLIAGAPTDNNAHLFRKGQLNVLQPAIDRGDIKIVGDQWAREWLPIEALQITENALTRTHNRIDVVVSSNDGMAGGAIQALAEQKLAGKVLVTGQDAELTACQRIVAGTQTMTVYKPLARLARTAAEVAVHLARKEPHGQPTRPVPNGKIDVPSILVDCVAVDRDNMAAVIVGDGFHTRDEIYRDVPADQRPVVPAATPTP